MMEHRIEKELSELSTTSSTAKRLTLTSWNGNAAKLDLRIWQINAEPAQPGKGITLTDAEAKTLIDALTAYFEAKASPEP